MVLASVIAGASGGALANVALSPLGGGAGLLQSYWYGAGLILGERMMYTFHWEKIKTRLDKGEDFMRVLESEMTPNITAIANFSLDVMKKTGAVYMQGGIDFMAQLIENMLKLLAGETITPPAIDPCPDGFFRDANGICQPVAPPPPTPDCPSGFRWSASAQQCVPEDIPEPESTPEPTPPPPVEPTGDILMPGGNKVTFTQAVNRCLQILTYNNYAAREGITASDWRVTEANYWANTYPEVFKNASAYINFSWFIGNAYPVWP